LIGGLAARDAIYCCGPEPLIAAVERQVSQRGLSELHVERFASADVALQANDSGFEVEIAKSGTTVHVGPHQTILEALEESGICPAASCREGVCGTCETSVLSGEIDHRDSILSAAERQAGRSMMICVSRARSGKLVLDM